MPKAPKAAAQAAAKNTDSSPAKIETDTTSADPAMRKTAETQSLVAAMPGKRDAGFALAPCCGATPLAKPCSPAFVALQGMAATSDWVSAILRIAGSADVVSV